MKQVLVYSTQYCASCVQVKKYLSYLGIDYTAIDISDNDELRKDIFEKAHAVTVPIVQYGRKYVTGYKPQELKELLGID